ncbi:MAG: hypothetical protein MHPSP_002206, partial [Paramarteilia canceri]
MEVESIENINKELSDAAKEIKSNQKLSETLENEIKTLYSKIDTQQKEVEKSENTLKQHCSK